MRPRGPRDPLRSTGPAPHINLHQKSTPETNSKAISRGFLIYWDGPGTCYVDGSDRHLQVDLDVSYGGAVTKVQVGCIRHASDMQVPQVHLAHLGH